MRYKESFEGLTDEMRAKAAACKTPEELLELAKREGYKLSDEQLEGIAGGYRTTCSDNDWSYCSDYYPNGR